MEQVTVAAQRFAHSTTMPEQLAVLRHVMAERLMKSFVATPEFRDGLRAMAETAQSQNSTTDRLLAIDGMIRIWSSSVPANIKGEIERLIASALEAELPPLSALNDLQESGVDKPSESRLNVVLALQMSNAGWISEYQFRNLVEEDKAPNVRLELAKRACFTKGSHSKLFCIVLPHSLATNGPHGSSEPRLTAVGFATSLAVPEKLPRAWIVTRAISLVTPLPSLLTRR